MMNSVVFGLTFSLTFILGGCSAQADEGMWLLNAFPTQKVQEKYGFTATPDWLRHVMLSSARLAGGCSGSFVSKSGLIMTNHHCAHSCIEQLSTPEKDYVASGFYAKKTEDEVRCPEIEINRLVEISEVSSRIAKATEGLEGEAYNQALKGAMATIEKECVSGSDLTRCDVVTLFHGGKYELYKYQRYQDVRLVFAPEMAIAFFGGDPDNFMFPRYDLDVSFLRVYENGKPLDNKEYFSWSKNSIGAGELTFVTGSPGRTSRLLTVAQLEYERDVRLIFSNLYFSELRGYLTEFGKRGPEQRRISEAKLFGVENSLKASKGKHQALLNAHFFSGKIQAEQELRQRVAANPEWSKVYGTAWDEIARAEEILKGIYLRLGYLENGMGFGGRLFRIAKVLVRAAVELQKPNNERFREFVDSALPAVRQDLFSTAPIYDEFEITYLTFTLTKLREALTADDPFVRKIFGNRSPEELATYLVTGTQLEDISLRKKLFEGGQKSILESQDPMILFVLLVDPDLRAVRKVYEDQVEAVVRKNSEKVARAQFSVYGQDTYPDATFTLRVSYGQIKGYRENGREVAPLTKMSGAFERHTGRDPFALPESWLNAKSSLNLETPMNFCSTNDIIGGNSGSPVINKNAEIVGLIFDGNIQSLGGDYGFDESVNRAVSVHSAALIESLDKIYRADRIVKELLPTKK